MLGSSATGQSVTDADNAGKMLVKKELGVLVDQTGASWNRLTSWLRNIEAPRIAVSFESSAASQSFQ
jgi:hypothetical protein